MELFVVDEDSTDESLISGFKVGSASASNFCYVIERPFKSGANQRDNPATPNINESSSIPEGRFRVSLSYSKTFKQIKFIVIGIPGRDGVRFDIANKASELLGCLAFGLIKGINQVNQSTDAYEKVCGLLLPELLAGREVWLNTIRPKS